MKLGEIERCRKIFERQIQVFSFVTDSWTKYAEFEASLLETERARAIFEIAINQQELDQPEGVWKAYIDFEMENDHNKVREIYERLLDITKHVKVWLSYAQFEGDT